MLSVSLGGPKRAIGFCGEPYPYWAYYIDFDEVSVPFEFQGYSGQVFARTVGNVKEQKKASVFEFPHTPGTTRASHGGYVFISFVVPQEIGISVNRCSHLTVF